MRALRDDLEPISAPWYVAPCGGARRTRDNPRGQRFRTAAAWLEILGAVSVECDRTGCEGVMLHQPLGWPAGWMDADQVPPVDSWLWGLLRGWTAAELLHRGRRAALYVGQWLNGVAFIDPRSHVGGDNSPWVLLARRAAACGFSAMVIDKSRPAVALLDALRPRCPLEIWGENLPRAGRGRADDPIDAAAAVRGPYYSRSRSVLESDVCPSGARLYVPTFRDCTPAQRSSLTRRGFVVCPTWLRGPDPLFSES